MRASGVRRETEPVAAYRETPAGEIDDGALAENTPCTGVRSCSKVRVLTS
jgi:hypothetical protein